LESLIRQNSFELLPEIVPIDEKGAASLVAAETVEQPDGVAPADRKQLFEAGSIDDGRSHLAQSCQGVWNMLKPLGLAGHSRRNNIKPRSGTDVPLPLKPRCK
jgi:hypothetical protein